jgi:hypothetical protein
MKSALQAMVAFSVGQRVRLPGSKTVWGEHNPLEGIIIDICPRSPISAPHLVAFVHLDEGYCVFREFGELEAVEGSGKT